MEKESKDSSQGHNLSMVDDGKYTIFLNYTSERELYLVNCAFEIISFHTKRRQGTPLPVWYQPIFTTGNHPLPSRKEHYSNIQVPPLKIQTPE